MARGQRPLWRSPDGRGQTVTKPVPSRPTTAARPASYLSHGSWRSRPGQKDTLAMTASPRMTRRAMAGAAFTCIAAFAAGCGTSSPSAGPATTAPATATSATPAATAAVSSAGASPSPAAKPAAAPGIAPCPTRYLGAKIGVSQGTAGSIYTVIDFTNIGNVTCTLYGYPGVSLAGGKPVTQIGLAATRSTITAKVLVTLKPGAVANALLQIVDAGNYSPATCGPATADYLQIYPPNQTTPIYLGYKSAACSKSVHILTVSVVVPGSGSSA
jgi:hypothetical protein